VRAQVWQNTLQEGREGDQTFRGVLGGVAKGWWRCDRVAKRRWKPWRVGWPHAIVKGCAALNQCRADLKNYYFSDIKALDGWYIYSVRILAFCGPPFVR
jgi:hypothetical protein